MQYLLSLFHVMFLQIDTKNSSHLPNSQLMVFKIAWGQFANSKTAAFGHLRNDDFQASEFGITRECNAVNGNSKLAELFKSFEDLRYQWAICHCWEWISLLYATSCFNLLETTKTWAEKVQCLLSAIDKYSDSLRRLTRQLTLISRKVLLEVYDYLAKTLQTLVAESTGTLNLLFWFALNKACYSALRCLTLTNYKRKPVCFLPRPVSSKQSSLGGYGLLSKDSE